MLEDGLTPEDVDTITGAADGRTRRAPRSAPRTSSASTPSSTSRDNCYATLTARRGSRRSSRCPRFIARDGRDAEPLGDKTKGGFYKKGKGDGQRDPDLDPKTGEYRAKGGDEALKDGHGAVAQDRGPAGKRVTSWSRRRPGGRVRLEGDCRAALAYSARRIGEITDDIVARSTTR